MCWDTDEGEEMPPLVSIIIPVYNGSDFMKEAIDSALGQSYEDIEVIVINDGSRDEGRTETLAKGYGDRIRYVAKENGGVASALNRGVKEARGEFVSWLSHDDAYEPNKIRDQLSFLYALSPSIRTRTIVYGNCLYMNERSEVYDRSHLPTVPPGRFYESLLCGRVIKSLWDQEIFFMNGCTALFSRLSLIKAGLFDESRRTTQDYDLWFKLCGANDFVLMDECVLRSRIHKHQGTYSLREFMAKEVEDLYDRALDLYAPGSPRYDLELAKTCFALRLDPRKKKAFRRAFPMALHQPPSPSRLMYLGFALLWTSWLAKIRIGLNSLDRRRKERSKKK